MKIKRSIHISAYAKLKEAHGGVKRSNQLRSIAREQGRLIIDPPSAHDLLGTFFRYPIYWIQAAFNFLRLTRYVSLRKSPVLFLQLVWIYQQIRHHRPSEIHIETTKHLSGMAYSCSLLKVPLIVYPHNIEFMVPKQQNPYCRSKLAAMALELEIYRRAISVETISDFDTTVLRCFGIEHVHTLNFEPVGSALSNLLNIKSERQETFQKGILILGSVINTPTCIGMERLLKIISKGSYNQKYVLAGYGTEKLREKCPSSVDVRGSIDEEELRYLLINCKALLINQPPTSGMLTRIIEAAVAGIPVYVMGGYIQPFALRDRGVQMISSLSELPSP